MSMEHPGPGHGVDAGCVVRGEHLPSIPWWQCRACGLPWPCDQAKDALLTEYEGNPIGLSLYLAACLHAAIDDLRGLRNTDGCVDVFDRFLGWTKRRASSQRVTATEPSPLPKETGS
ncbi:hypothetical protein ACIBCR_29845 [Micromonospora echinospora]|uniref:hypothetical protein n=1 Tax=Micromonospora echinospora TaxID=1877 RepID=UPI00378AE726